VDVSGQLPHVLEEHRDGHTTRYLYGAGVMGVETDGAPSEWPFSVNGALLYQHADALGSVRQLTDQAGSVRQARGYSPFGAPTSAAGQSAGSFGFAGEQYDPSTGSGRAAASGLIFLRARYYDPTVGRFLTRDTYPALAPAPQSLHRYAYCGNDPVNRTDPSGQWWVDDAAKRVRQARPAKRTTRRVEDGGGKGSKDNPPPPPPQSDTGHRDNAYEMRKRFEADDGSRAVANTIERGDLDLGGVFRQGVWQGAGYAVEQRLGPMVGPLASIGDLERNPSMAGFHHAFWGGAEAWVSTAFMMAESYRYTGTAIAEGRWEDVERGARGLAKEFATLATVPYRVQWEVAKGILLSPFNTLVSRPSPPGVFFQKETGASCFLVVPPDLSKQPPSVRKGKAGSGTSYGTASCSQGMRPPYMALARQLASLTKRIRP